MGQSYLLNPVILDGYIASFYKSEILWPDAITNIKKNNKISKFKWEKKNENYVQSKKKKKAQMHTVNIHGHISTSCNW